MKILKSLLTNNYLILSVILLLIESITIFLPTLTLNFLGEQVTISVWQTQSPAKYVLAVLVAINVLLQLIKLVKHRLPTSIIYLHRLVFLLITVATIIATVLEWQTQSRGVGYTIELGYGFILLLIVNSLLFSLTFF